MKGGYSLYMIEERCKVLHLNEKVIGVILKCWNNKSTQIATSLLNKTLSNNQLVDLDWSFGVTASSDDCDHVGKTYLQIKLTIDDGESGRKDLFLELSLEQFYQFLASLEKCRSFLDFVSPTNANA